MFNLNARIYKDRWHVIMLFWKQLPTQYQPHINYSFCLANSESIIGYAVVFTGELVGAHVISLLRVVTLVIKLMPGEELANNLTAIV